MTFFMVCDKKTGLCYKRVHGRSIPCWAPKEEASVWTTRAGASEALGSLTRRNRNHFIRDPQCEPEIVEIPFDRPQCVLVDGDDWEGFYVNGKLIAQHHHVQLGEIFEALGNPFEHQFADTKWLCERGNLPENLSEVRLQP
ncbi:MAG: hypothetical protein ABFC88_12390 [Thermoguttaceae bacterium]